MVLQTSKVGKVAPNNKLKTVRWSLTLSNCLQNDNDIKSVTIINKCLTRKMRAAHHNCCSITKHERTARLSTLAIVWNANLVHSFLFLYRPSSDVQQRLLLKQFIWGHCMRWVLFNCIMVYIGQSKYREQLLLSDARLIDWWKRISNITGILSGNRPRRPRLLGCCLTITGSILCLSAANARTCLLI